MVLDWSQASTALSEFGGEPITMTVRRSGLPFFDALQLYGAIDLYVGVRDDIQISDNGDHWQVNARRRAHRLLGKDKLAFAAFWKKRKPGKEQYCSELSRSLQVGKPVKDDPAFNELSLGRLDPSLQAGIRGLAASDYETLKSAQTSKKTCIATVPLSQALLARVGRGRVLRLGDITFLPIFEGPVDLSKVISPIRISLTVPNVLCAQALALLALRSCLFAEGYQDRLSQVVFETSLGSQRSDNYSGAIAVGSTAIGRMGPAEFIDRMYRAFRVLVHSAWTRRSKKRDADKFATDAMDAVTTALWLLQPLPKHLDSMLISQEKLHRLGQDTFLRSHEDVQGIFKMSYPAWQGDHDAVRKFARAVASGIYFARMAPELDNNRPGKPAEKWRAARKAWYDEVTMLRTTSSNSSFFERALILIEQGHREHGDTGTRERDEAFDPPALIRSVDADSFETFKMLFRMYLVQESKPRNAQELNIDKMLDEGEEA